MKILSGRRDLNPRLQPWQGCALPRATHFNIDSFDFLYFFYSGVPLGSPIGKKINKVHWIIYFCLFKAITDLEVHNIYLI